MINILLDEMGYFSRIRFPTTRHESNYLQANLELAKLGVIKHMSWRDGSGLCCRCRTAYRLVPGLEHLNLSISTPTR